MARHDEILKEQPFISVIMPAYNAERYVGDAINSLLNQTYKNFEIIIIDDASQDKTAKIILSCNDPRIKYYKNSCRLGVGKSLNRAFFLSGGDFIARMDADDISYPQRLEKQVQYLLKNPDAGLVATKVDYINETGQKIAFRWPNNEKINGSFHIRWTLPRVNCFTHVTVMFRRKTITQHLYDEAVFAEDYELWLRLACDGIKITKMDEVLMAVRKQPESITALSIKENDGGINQMIEAKKCFLKKKISSRQINLFVFLVSLFLFKDIILYKSRDVIRLVWRDFDR